MATIVTSLFVTERLDHSPFSLPLPSSIGDYPPGMSIDRQQQQQQQQQRPQQRAGDSDEDWHAVEYRPTSIFKDVVDIDDLLLSGVVEQYMFSYGLTVTGLMVAWTSIVMYLSNANAKRPISTFSRNRTMVLTVLNASTTVCRLVIGHWSLVGVLNRFNIALVDIGSD
jgi:hypothetical protein